MNSDINYKIIEKKLIDILGKYSSGQKRCDLNQLDLEIKKYIDDLESSLSSKNEQEKTKIINDVYIMCDNIEYQYFGFCN